MNAPASKVGIISVRTVALRAELELNKDNIPADLKKKKCWLVWKTTEISSDTGKFNKIPKYPNSRKNRCGKQGGPQDLEGLGSWEEAYAAFSYDKSLAGIGIALLQDFGIVALDVDRCVKDGKLRDDVADLIDLTYCELSPSGTGIRAFWLGTSSNSKNHDSGFELFHSTGFVTVTGNQIANEYFMNGNGIPVLSPDMQTKLEGLAHQAGKVNSKVGRVEKSDRLKQAAQNDLRLQAIVNARLYECDLGNGKHSIQCPFEIEHSDYGREGGDGDTVYFQPHTNGYSEGWIHCMHTHDNDQNKYWEAIGYDIHTEMFENLEVHDSADALPDISQDSGVSKSKFDIEYPPGLAGGIAEYVFKSSRMRVKSFAIAAALTVIAQLNANRAYVKKSNTALNLYQCLIGDTGKGKEDPRKAIKRLLDAAKDFDRSSIHESIASGAALLRSLENKPNTLILMDELGMYLKVAISDKGSIHQKEFIKEIMTLFGVGRSFFAGKSYANANQNIGRINRPYINLLGTTTPLELFDGITLNLVDNGLLNRFLFIPASEENAINREPDIEIHKDLAQGMAYITGIGSFKEKEELDYESGAHELLIELVEKHTKTGQFANLWNRAEEMTIRIAGLVSLGDGGIIKQVHVQWAWRYVTASINAFVERLEQELTENPFQEQVVKAKKFIRMAKNYKDDKQFGKYCERGYMPKGKLTKLLKVKSKEVNEIVNFLLETQEIKIVNVDGIVCFTVL